MTRVWRVGMGVGVAGEDTDLGGPSGGGAPPRDIADLKSQRERWQSDIGEPANQPANIDRWIAMFELLWKGQTRHVGSSNSRPQTQEEAEAAVHLAANLVQWLSTGALRKTP